jgi:hypothetical protein
LKPKTSVTQLPQPRAGLAVAVCDSPFGAGSAVYAIGGNVTATGAAFDTDTNTWSLIRGLPTPRLYHAATSTPGQLHALGGQTEIPTWVLQKTRKYVAAKIRLAGSPGDHPFSD